MLYNFICQFLTEFHIIWFSTEKNIQNFLIPFYKTPLQNAVQTDSLRIIFEYVEFMQFLNKQIGGCGDRQSVYELNPDGRQWTKVEGSVLPWPMNNVPGDTVEEEDFIDAIEC